MKSMLSAKLGAIIPAAGQGERMGGQGNKLLLELAGTPILLYTLKLFEDCPFIGEIIISAARNDIPVLEKMTRDSGLKKVSSIVEGGRERQDSVARALRALNPDIQGVVVHDGARPLLTLEGLNGFLEEAVILMEAADLKAAVMGIGLKDTVKIVDSQGWVVQTPVRDDLRVIQTPQFFQRSLLEKVHKLALTQGFYTTDDAALMEWQGYAVKVLPGSYENIKITTPEDLLLAEAILHKRLGAAKTK